MSEKEKTKRFRSSNWTAEEKACLVDSIKRNPIIEDKTCDSRKHKYKVTAWNNVKETLMVNGIDRDLSQIKQQWRKMKRESRTRIAAQTKAWHETGGGSDSADSPNELDWTIKDIAPSLFINDASCFDSDGQKTEQTVIVSTSDKAAVQPEILTSCAGPSTSSTADETIYELCPLTGLLLPVNAEENKQSSIVNSAHSKRNNNTKAKRGMRRKLKQPLKSNLSLERASFNIYKRTMQLQRINENKKLKIYSDYYKLKTVLLKQKHGLKE